MQRLAIGILCAVVVACGTTSPVAPSPATPSPPIPDVTGTWRGTWVVTGCTGSGPPGCDRLTPGSFEFRVFEQSGATLTVTLSIRNAFALEAFDWAEFIGLSGEVAGDGRIALPVGPGQVYVRDAQGRSGWLPGTLDTWQVSVTNGVMAGSLQFSGRFEDRSLMIAGRLSNVARVIAP